MKCQGLGEQLSAYIDGELQKQKALEVERHLASCARCTEELKGLHAVRALMSQKQPMKLSPFFWTRLAARLQERERETLWFEFGYVTKRLIPVAVAVTLLIIAVSFWHKEQEPVALEPYLLDSASPRLERAVMLGEENLTSGEVLQWTVMTE